MLQQAWDACKSCILKVCQPYSVVITRGMAFDDWYEEQKWGGNPLVDAGLDLYHVIQQICGIGAVLCRSLPEGSCSVRWETTAS